MEPLSFFVGLMLGIAIVGVADIIHEAWSNAIFSPDLSGMINCMNDCSSAGDFGSPEFNACVNRCLIRKRGGVPARAPR